MNSNRMCNYSGLLVLIAGVGIVWELFTGYVIAGVFPMIIMSGIYGVGSVIVRRPEALTVKLNQLTSKG